MNRFFTRNSLLTTGLALILSTNLIAEDEAAWWDKNWTQRQKINLDASELTASAGDSSTLLVRLFEGNFQFAGAREDGSDIRFVAADGKTILPYQIESYDGLLSEAFVWVKLPVKPSAKETLHIYYGNQDPAMPAAEKSGAFAKDHVAVYHFAERGGSPADSSGNNNNASAPAVTAQGAIIGNGARLLGSTPINIPNTDSLAWSAGQALSISLWVKPTALQSNAVILSRTEGNNALRLTLDQGVPMLEVSGTRSQAAAPIAAGTWSHLALTSGEGKIQLYVNGEPYASVAAAIPALASPLLIGADASGTNTTGFTGEIDELQITKSTLPAGAIKLASINQGASDSAQRLLSLGEMEGGEASSGGGALEHVMLFGDIAKNMMFDGWIAIGVCVLMIAVGWTVAYKKFIYLGKVEKADKEFLKIWKTVSTDLTAIDHSDGAKIRSMGGSADADAQDMLKDSPLYNIYHIGSEEISHRLHKINHKMEGLPGRSIQAIRASLDAGMVHENHKLTDGLVYLTISIAGGPYVGLLGTVVGVMITFAIIAKSGEVNVNSIAPGIASALLATVVGLIVAIPALFIYSYLNGRIKTVMANMQVFIDEFVAKMAEFYRPPNEPEGQAGKSIS